jgi:hypothetical protein
LPSNLTGKENLRVHVNANKSNTGSVVISIQSNLKKYGRNNFHVMHCIYLYYIL